ncbi:hypothetical protein BST37_17445 [Mycobacterium noviomagense]|uniref:Cytochrome b561 bacterial/Ni-hydrogenase domain-containing protein n=1 Tax=Mycobacterium noviomagense TaxID=459858 RepID=A0ABX3T1H4_9MYCO|nr:hypothetical protein BST37_17445 [Mycobacterium noviomagense]
MVRIGNRLTYRTPALPSTVGPLERRLVVVSDVSLYALLAIQPLIGWAMLSAGGGPVVVLGSVRLPRIAPFDAHLFWLLRQGHSIVAYALLVVIAAHVSAIMLHTVTLRDGMLSRMTFALTPARRRGRPLRVIGVARRKAADVQTRRGVGYRLRRQAGDRRDRQAPAVRAGGGRRQQPRQGGPRCRRDLRPA